MEPIPQEFQDLVSAASPNAKLAMLEFIRNSIQIDKPITNPPKIKDAIPTTKNISSFVTLIPEFCGPGSLLKDLKEEAESLGLVSETNKVKTQWLNSTVDAYVYGSSGHEVSHKAKPIKEYPAICELLKLVNNNDASTHDMNSCLVSCFSTSDSNLSLHADDENGQIDQNSSICTLSLGATRTMDFCSKKSRTRNPIPITSLELKDGCLTIMHPGCQEVLNHRINSGIHEDGVSDIRYSFSFRKFISPNEINVSSSTISHPKVSSDQSGKVRPKPNIILVAGDSFTARLETEKLGKKKKTVMNISKGGNTISAVVKSLEAFAKDNDSFNIQKLFLCVGTNDIRHAHYGIRHLKNPFINMLKTAKQLFPNSTIYCQSLIPLPIMKSNTVRNVSSMNSLIFDACTRQRVFYLDVFCTFLNRYGFRSELFFPRNVDDIHPNKRGIAVLAKHYIYSIRTKTFNPVGY